MDWPRLLLPEKDAISSYDALGPTLVAMGKFSGTTGGVAWPTANRAIFVPFVVRNRLVAVKLGLALSNAGSGNVDVGIYDKGGNRLTSAGSTAMNATGFSQLFDTTDVTLPPGQYYMAVSQSTTGTNIPGVQMANAGLIGACGVLQMAAALPLPNPATFAANGFTIIPEMYVLQRTIG